MGSFLITRRLDIDPALFDFAQVSYVLALLVFSFTVGVSAREFCKTGTRMQFAICIGVLASALVGFFLAIQSAFRVPELQFLPDLTFIMMVFSTGFFLREFAAFVEPYVTTQVERPVAIRIETRDSERHNRR